MEEVLPAASPEPAGRCDQVEIACPMPEQAALVWEKAQRHEWPVTIGPGIPVALTRPGRALLAFCEWVTGGLAASRLRRMLQSGDVRLEADGLTAGQAARLLARARGHVGAADVRGRARPAHRAPPGPGRGSRAIGSRRGRGTRERAAQAERFRQWTAELLALVPEQPMRAARAVARRGGRLREDLRAEGQRAGWRGHAWRSRRRWPTCGALGDLTRPASDALALIRGRFDGLTVGGDRARPGHLHVTTLADAGHAGRPRTFVIGLEEGGVFPALVEDPVLLDAERKGIDQALRTSEDRVGEALYRIVSRLGSLRGHVCLSYSCRDLRQARATFPSWVLLQAVRVLKPGENWTYDRLVEELGEPVSAVPAEADQALSDAGWWLAGLRRADASALPAVREGFPALAQGAVAEAARDSDVFTDVRRARARGRADSRSARVGRRRVADQPRGSGQVPVPLLPPARARARHRRRRRAESRRVARSADARIAHARPLRHHHARDPRPAGDAGPGAPRGAPARARRWRRWPASRAGAAAVGRSVRAGGARAPARSGPLPEVRGRGLRPAQAARLRGGASAARPRARRSAGASRSPSISATGSASSCAAASTGSTSWPTAPTRPWTTRPAARSCPAASTRRSRAGDSSSTPCTRWPPSSCCGRRTRRRAWSARTTSPPGAGPRARQVRAGVHPGEGGRRPARPLRPARRRRLRPHAGRGRGLPVLRLLARVRPEGRRARRREDRAGGERDPRGVPEAERA